MENDHKNDFFHENWLFFDIQPFRVHQIIIRQKLENSPVPI